MRIAVFVKQFPAISQTFVLNQITGLLDCGHDVLIFAEEPSDASTQDANFDMYRIAARVRYYGEVEAGRYRGRLILYLRKAFNVARYCISQPRVVIGFLRYGKIVPQMSLSGKLRIAQLMLRETEPFDVLHCHFGPNGNLAALLKRVGLIRGILITTFHGYDLSRYLLKNGNDIYKLLFEIGDLFLPISRAWEAKLRKLGCPPERVVVHHMGVSIEEYPIKKSGGNQNTRLLSVGRLVEKKGFLFAIRAFSEIAQEFPNVVYSIAGDGPLRGELAQLIDGFGLAGRVNLLGWKEHEEIRHLMMQSDILIVPSVIAKDGDQEGIPVVLMEALAHGIPVLSTWHSGIPELVEDGRSGYLVPERDVHGLASRLRTLLRNPNQWDEMGKAGREFVEQHFEIRKLNERLVELFEAKIMQKQSHRKA